MSIADKIAASAAKAADNVDSRYHLAPGLRRQINKVFPSHWSFMLGEIALYSFIILILSGFYLTMFFDPSMTEVTYNGVYAPLRGVEMSRAFETALNISFEVRGGLFIRQIHHWAALLFVASIIAHLLRIFFTGAFRRPREANWIIGCLILVLAMFEGFFGYTLPDDLLSGTGLRAAMGGITLSIPVVGTWMHWALFGGDFPGDIIIPRLYMFHILLFPLLLLALVAVHLALVWYQKHTQFAGTGRTEHNVVGLRILPLFGVKAGAFFFLNFGVIVMMAGLLQINPIWNMGPYNPSQVSAGSQPDFYMMWTDGMARLWPAWELYFGGYTVPAVFAVAIVMGLVFGVLFAYPFLEAKLSNDHAHHNILQRPRDNPIRTGIGAMAVGFYMVLTLSCVNDIIAYKFSISLNATTWMGRIGVLIVPPIAYYVAYRWALGLQRQDRAILEHGIETGIVKRLPHGEFIEIHQPLGPVDDHGHPLPLSYQGAAVPHKMNQLGLAGAPGRGSILTADPAVQTQALDKADHEAHHKSLEMLQQLQDRIHGNGSNGSSNGEAKH
ncbi:cytochrome b [Smaragdicoccus niigatensis]|uniref:cytochrome bc1 complex cytochrome b subunit n=1 Tax=Smaragdicoccus niigatensis TaxID=359359 RepID=UPI0003823EC0|nr:cytochrome bc complex cytochrome b subunit [Smaragdicoccus niigatensis]